MPQKVRSRPTSANRQRRQGRGSRRSSFSGDATVPDTIVYPDELAPLESTTFYAGLDIRPLTEKIAGLEKELAVPLEDTTLEERLQSLVLLQLYTHLEYGERSIENARAYVNLGKFYYDHQDLLPQAKTHILNARQVLEQLNIQPTEQHLLPNALAFEVYLLLAKYSLLAKQHTPSRDSKTRNKHIAAIDTSHIEHDLDRTQDYLAQLQAVLSSSDYDVKSMDYLWLRFEATLLNTKQFQSSVSELIEAMIAIIDQYPPEEQSKRKIDIYLRSGSYFVGFPAHVIDGLNFFKIAVELAEKEEEQAPSDVHKYQLASAIFQWGKIFSHGDTLDNTERKFHRAIDIYKQVDGVNNREVLRVMDELATLYTKTEKFQEALNVLCESLPDKKLIFGEFSDEVIQTESRIGAIYLRECEYLNAAEHLKECLDLQEFVYGPKDPRTSQTRSALDILKRDPTVSRTFFSRTQEGIRKDRPAFRLSNKVSHDKDDHDVLLTVTKKPPISSKN